MYSMSLPATPLANSLVEFLSSLNKSGVTESIIYLGFANLVRVKGIPVKSRDIIDIEIVTIIISNL